jgi:DNA polymerase V
LDRIKQKYPNSPVKSAAEGKVQAWRMQRNYLSPNYTGDWSQLLEVK